MHQIVMGRHHSLLVTNEEKIIGILRSTDVFNWLYDKIGDCNL
jgi:predicted transcriptional regulator